MRGFLVPAALLVGAISPPAHAADWVLIGRVNETQDWLADRDSIEISGAYRYVAIRKGAIRSQWDNYHSALQRWKINCGKKTHAIELTVTYDANGKELSRIEALKTMDELGMYPMVAGSSAEAVVKFVCK